MERIVKAELEAIASDPKGYPERKLPEIAFAGRSNVGKSSLLNYICGRKKLAYVSGNPGKTRTINFYLINDKFRIVDLPGYGYARTSRKISEEWGKMIESYLTERENLLKVVQLVDIRHKPSTQDIQMYEYLRYYNLDGLVVATKADKVSANEKAKALGLIRKTLGLTKNDSLIPISSLKKTGKQELILEMERIWRN